MSITESPSGSIPVVCTGIRTGVPATARAVRLSGLGAVLSASRGTIVMYTSAEPVRPVESTTSYCTTASPEASSFARKRTWS